VKLTAKVKLLADLAQTAALLETLERVNQACDWVSEKAWKAKKFRQYSIHALTYGTLRERFGLSAQLAVRCIAKVADVYKVDKKTQRAFHAHGSIAYDSRILTWDIKSQSVSIRTLGKRLKIRFSAGAPQLALLGSQRGESNLIYSRGTFYLAATCEVTESAQVKPSSFLGVDLGIAEIASTSDGVRHRGHAPPSAD
jgi:putative transposase